jgi:signal transduction histidine kinase
MAEPLEDLIAKRLGVLPNFFRLASQEPDIAANLWGFAEFGYLNNPLPSLFKERLFVYLSRFCEIRYCIARHLGFLVGLGYPAGDPAALCQTVEAVLPLLRRPLPHGESMAPLLDVLARLEKPISSFPEPDSTAEQAIIACATHVFLQTPDAPKAHEGLRRILDPSKLEHLHVFLSFVRTAHYWTKLHPELSYEDDVQHLLATHEALAQCVLREPEPHADGLSRRIAEDLASLREIRAQRDTIARAYESLSIDHLYVKDCLYERETNLSELLSLMPAAIYACDADGIVTYHNRQAVDLWGRAPQLTDPAWFFLDSRRLYRLDGTRLRADEAPVKEVLRTGVPIINRELILERPDYSSIHVLTNVAALRDAAGVVCGAVNIFQDISEIKAGERERERLVRELERSNRELSQFSFAVSHDLQTPVRSIRALTQVLVRRNEGPSEDILHVSGLIEQAADGMGRLIESLLHYAQAGHGELSRRTVPVDSVIDGVRATLAPLIAETGAKLVCKHLPSVEADPVLLEQVFQNLVANAIKYHRTEVPPIIEIWSEPFEDGWGFAVKDNGQGIPGEFHSAIFEPLKRLHGGETAGTGLGLTLARTIVARHGGRIWVESDVAGTGATFRFTLSRTAAKMLAIGQTR